MRALPGNASLLAGFRRLSRESLASIRLIEEQRRRDQIIGRRLVARERYVVEDRKTQKRFDIDVVRLRRKRIPEENDRIEALLCDHRADLRIATERP